MNKQEGKIRVTKLAEDFNIVYSNKKVLERQKYNETTVRQKFIDPFFEALGWNIKSYDEVFLEYPQTREDDSKGRADYAFTLGDGKTFFVEAKKPSENLELNSKHALQARLYAFNASHPVVILTDFEEFFVYLGRGHEPKPGDKVNTSLIAELCCKYTEYADKWDMLWDAFSRERVMAGSLDKLPGVKKDSKGSKTVDAIFLADIEQWRKALAVNLHGNNPNLSRRALNETTQKTIDRIIFLRICEDREIENYGALRKLADKPSVYKALCKLFADADTRYNSGLFHFKEEKGRGNADSSHLNLHIDDEPLQAMILRLYFPGGPYAFAVMPADILGQVYERFLGKVIEIKPDGSVDVEIKPEVKKAGGVFYTPEYIVSYIVQNTVGKLLEKKKPADIAKLKILDPACGSGAFLIKAYQYLLDWHLAYYIKNKTPTWAKEKRIAKDERPLIDGTESKWQLTLLERKRILLAHIHGVDIDPQAVEVTRLSLLLKCLEGETRRTLQMGLFDHAERILPDLDKNIKCGNSLIGRDFYENMQAQLFDREAKLRINAFDWQTEFKEIMDDGGFDVVIGNPPYLRIQGLTENNNNQLNYYIQNYKSAVKRFDLYLLFIEKSFSLLNKTGMLGYICPNKFVNSDFGSGLRDYLIQNKAIECFISFGNNLVFSTASTYTGILLLSKRDNLSLHYYELPNIGNESIQKRLENLENKQFTEYATNKFNANPWVLSCSGTDTVLSKIGALKKLSDSFSNIFQGVVTGADNLYFLRACGDKEECGVIEVFSERENKTIRIERAILKPVLKGENVARYQEPEHKYFTIYPYEEKNGKTTILKESELSAHYPLAYKYLSVYKDELRELRIKYKTNATYWYSCHRGREMSLFEQQRIITPEISLGCNMTISPAGLYHNTKVYSFIPKTTHKDHMNYWLGILNSKLMWFFISSTGYVLRGGYYVFKTEYLKPFPIRTIDFADKADMKLHNDMVKLVENMIAHHKELHALGLDSQEKRSIEQDIAATDAAIDSLVYQLYDLNDAEIKIVEAR